MNVHGRRGAQFGEGGREAKNRFMVRGGRIIFVPGLSSVERGISGGLRRGGGGLLPVGHRDEGEMRVGFGSGWAGFLLLGPVGYRQGAGQERVEGVGSQ